MEDYTEFTEPEPGMETEGYTEENTAEIPDESQDETDTQPEESGAGTAGPENPEDSENNTDSGENSGVITDTENSVPGASGDSTEDDAGMDDTNLLERVENLLDVLAPETDGENSTVESGENTEPEISECDTQAFEALQSINETLSTIRAENELFRTETLQYREKTEETHQTVINCLEINALLLIGVGFFVALLCGGKFADIFFRRMRGKD